MKTLPCLLLLSLFAFQPIFIAGGQEKKGPPDPAEVTAAMKKAVAFCQTKLAVHGGYASTWKKDLSLSLTEGHESTTATLISIQPPGTTTIGLALVKAYQATGDKQFFDAARAATQSLIECQLESGGWTDDFDFAEERARQYYLHQDALKGDKEKGKRRNTSTLDDNKTESALLFILELAHLPECKDDAVLQESLKFGLDSLLAAQFPNGAWPQQFDGPADPATPIKKAAYPKEWSRTFPAVKYSGYYTLNDDNMQQCVKVLLRAHELTGDKRFLDSAKKAGDFFILAQMPEPQTGWAQQYNQDMEPVWARKFEPPAVSGGESVGVIEALLELWVVTGEDKYLAPIKPAMAWLECSTLSDGQHARFYELQTNKPLYFVKDTYVLTYDDSNMPTHYGFKFDHVKPHLEAVKQQLTKPREELLAKRAGPQTPKEWASKAKGAAGKAAAAMQTQQPDGSWISGDEIDARDITKHLMAMAAYVEARKKTGEVLK